MLDAESQLEEGNCDVRLSKTTSGTSDDDGMSFEGDCRSGHWENKQKVKVSRETRFNPFMSRSGNGPQNLGLTCDNLGGINHRHSHRNAMYLRRAEQRANSTLIRGIT